LLAAALASSCGVTGIKAEERKPPTMSNTQAVFQLLAALEKEMPWSTDKVQRTLGVTLKKPSLFSDKKGLEFNGRASYSGLVITNVRFVPAEREIEAELMIRLDKNDVDEVEVTQRLPKGFPLPPPPPGYGGVPNPRGIWVADRDWGQVFFAFTAAGLWAVTFSVGQHGSPGI
jgi:hypothetical protein